MQPDPTMARSQTTASKPRCVTCGPFFVELPFRAASVPGWVYLPIEDCVILMETARRLADGLGRRLNAGSPIDQAPFEPDPDAGGS